MLYHKCYYFEMSNDLIPLTANTTRSETLKYCCALGPYNNTYIKRRINS